jgi:hypothetical protein
MALRVLGLLFVGLLLGGCEAKPPASGSAPQKTAAPPCATQSPCRLLIRFGYTTKGLNGLQPSSPLTHSAVAGCRRTRRERQLCLLDRVAARNTASIRRAFRASGLSGTRQWPTVVFDYSVDTAPSDSPGGTDIDGNEMDGATFNNRLLSEIAKTKPDLAERAQIRVVFTGLGAVLGGCVANSAARDGVIVMPACLSGYAADIEDLLFLHEAGHTFGAAHNDNGAPQPCVATAGALGPPACAWEQRLDPGPTDPASLRLEPRAFCTLVGQFNYWADFCRAHKGGENGGGWIREYSHPGKCRTPGWEAYDCGDATHDAVSVMRRRLPYVAARTAGAW